MALATFSMGLAPMYVAADYVLQVWPAVQATTEEQHRMGKGLLGPRDLRPQVKRPVLNGIVCVSSQSTTVKTLSARPANTTLANQARRCRLMGILSLASSVLTVPWAPSPQAARAAADLGPTVPSLDFSPYSLGTRLTMLCASRNHCPLSDMVVWLSSFWSWLFAFSS